MEKKDSSYGSGEKATVGIQNIFSTWNILNKWKEAYSTCEKNCKNSFAIFLTFFVKGIMKILVTLGVPNRNYPHLKCHPYTGQILMILIFSANQELR